MTWRTFLVSLNLDLSTEKGSEEPRMRRERRVEVFSNCQQSCQRHGEFLHSQVSRGPFAVIYRKSTAAVQEITSLNVAISFSWRYRLRRALSSPKFRLDSHRGVCRTELCCIFSVTVACCGWKSLRGRDVQVRYRRWSAFLSILPPTFYSLPTSIHRMQGEQDAYATPLAMVLLSSPTLPTCKFGHGSTFDPSYPAALCAICVLDSSLFSYPIIYEIRKIGGSGSHYQKLECLWLESQHSLILQLQI